MILLKFVLKWEGINETIFPPFSYKTLGLDIGTKKENCKRYYNLVDLFDNGMYKLSH